MMKKIGIITDEGADIPQGLIEKYDIGMVPVKLEWPEVLNLPGENIFQKMRELEKRGMKSFGKTSQPSPKDFIDKYKEFLSRYENLLCITLTSQHSGTYNSAIQGKNFLSLEEQEKINVFDSWQCSSSEGLLVLRAVELIEEKKITGEIMKELEKYRSKIKFYAMFEDPKWLEASGRISSLVANFLRRMTKKGIRVFLTFKKGKLVPGGIKTKAQDTVEVFFRQFNSDNEKIKNSEKKIKVAITHGDDWPSAQRLKEMIEKNYSNAQVVFINLINNIVGAITGPNTLTAAWLALEN